MPEFIDPDPDAYDPDGYIDCLCGTRITGENFTERFSIWQQHLRVHRREREWDETARHQDRAGDGSGTASHGADDAASSGLAIQRWPAQ